MTSVEENVKKLLLESCVYRDSDKRLLLAYWEKYDHINTVNFYQWFLNEATDPETLRRSRQKLQQENPSLRGKAWDARHRQADLVREVLR
jgi:hypothetical protein